jgi:hypothetical protein
MCRFFHPDFNCIYTECDAVYGECKPSVKQANFRSLQTENLLTDRNQISHLPKLEAFASGREGMPHEYGGVTGIVLVYLFLYFFCLIYTAQALRPIFKLCASNNMIWTKDVPFMSLVDSIFHHKNETKCGQEMDNPLLTSPRPICYQTNEPIFTEFLFILPSIIASVERRMLRIA